MAKLLCVYCASSDRLDPKYYAVAAELGREMVLRGWGLVYGGGKTGIMGAIARAVKQNGGRVVGVIPEFMKVRELAYDEADELGLYLEGGLLREPMRSWRCPGDGERSRRSWRS